MAQNKRAPESARMQKHIITKDKILQVLIRAEGKPVSRKRLRSLFRLEDRVVRDYIAELRDDGWMVGISENGGYSYGNETDFIRTIRLYEARRNKESARIRKMKKTLEGQRQVILDEVVS